MCKTIQSFYKQTPSLNNAIVHNIFAYCKQAKFFPYKKTIYVSKPTWGNHVPIFKYVHLCKKSYIISVLRNCGLDVEFYRHYDPKTCGFDAPAANEDLTVHTASYASLCLMFSVQNIPDNSIVLFHACGHNPTGVDPTVRLAS